MNLSTIKKDYEVGSKSGYHSCCQHWFIVRSFIVCTTGFFINWFQPARVQHIVCPIHWLLLKLRLTKFTYSKCSTCRNVRLDRKHNKECPFCADCKHRFYQNEAECKHCGFERNPLHSQPILEDDDETISWEHTYDEY